MYAFKKKFCSRDYIVQEIGIQKKWLLLSRPSSKVEKRSKQDKNNRV